MPRSDFQTSAQYAALGNLHLARSDTLQSPLPAPALQPAAPPTGLAKLGAYEAQASR